jgi:hypothetical protein
VSNKSNYQSKLSIITLTHDNIKTNHNEIVCEGVDLIEQAEDSMQ